MKIGSYAVEPEAISALLANLADSVRVRTWGIPSLPEATPEAIARRVLQDNAKAVLFAGTGHFRYMWISDFGKALRGAEQVLSPSYLRGLIAFMIRESRRNGRVTSCFSASRGFDMPYRRGDNLPWLLYSVAEFGRWTGDTTLLQENRADLQWLLRDYERSHISDDRIDSRITGDWMDTILRPSSTYNNLCALKMLQLAPKLGLATATNPQAFEDRLLSERWRGDHFADYHATDAFSVDSGVFALYFELFSPELRESVIRGIEASGLARPCPIRCASHEHDPRLMPLLTRFSPKYHSSVWLHLGLAYLNGLRRAGKDVSAHKQVMDHFILKYGHMVEALDERGEPYETFFHSTEYGLSMAAGQYLELVAGDACEP